MEIATKIAKNIRHINGGLRYVKAMGVELKERNITQVSINKTDYFTTYNCNTVTTGFDTY